MGKGDKIKIWKDRWLPNPSTYKVISPMTRLDPEATVDSLICDDSMTWNLPLLHSMFMARDVECILSIPLSKRKPADVLIWNGTKQGTFSVKNAYMMLYSHQVVAEASSSSSRNSAQQFCRQFGQLQSLPRFEYSYGELAKVFYQHKLICLIKESLIPFRVYGVAMKQKQKITCYGDVILLNECGKSALLILLRVFMLTFLSQNLLTAALRIWLPRVWK